MAYYFSEPSRTFGEYLLVPGYSSSECIPTAVSLKTPLVKYRKGEEPAPSTMNIPHGFGYHAVRFRREAGHCPCQEGGVSLFTAPSPSKAKLLWCARQGYKAGFVTFQRFQPAAGGTLADVLALKANRPFHHGRHR